MNSVIKGASFVLAFAPDMVLHNGTTQTTERVVNPNSEYLKELPSHLRCYEDVLAYAPNQTFIGNITPQELAKIEQPWHQKKISPERFGPFGEIMPQDEFILLMQICDVFDLVKLEESFVVRTKDCLAKDPVIPETVLVKAGPATSGEEIKRLVEEEHSEALFCNGELVGCIKRAHDVDVNLSAHVIFENLVSKAGNVLAILHLLHNGGIDPLSVDYVIDASEEACGDMNQRGGGNFAKAAAEVAGLLSATGSDMRSFCAAPAHAVATAAALVKSGAFKNVIVSAGGSTSKLGMNGKDHVKKGMPILEDVLGGFAVIVSENDGTSPEINLNMLGRHTVGTGSSPQAVITDLVLAPLKRNGLRITDVEKYSPELQNPDITKPAGAGDVPLSNYKMIGALAVKEGEIERADLANFPEKHGLVGWAPTQGHIPSGVPYLGFARQDIMAGKLKNAMIIGKGSLFLGRMTNQFDGISFIIQPNSGANKDEKDVGVSESVVRSMIADAMKSFALSIMAEEGKNV
ncbi:MAG: glycine/sarcosine/betaine reductase complex component C subunit beta [Oscillospiraceae bacterium]|nr:glycine/sarcosine/betaine reductase complex component C subunit beta [Oscillospiraceae bacterium]